MKSDNMFSIMSCLIFCKFVSINQDAQAKQWKKEFLAKLTDRMQTTVELMNEFDKILKF